MISRSREPIAERVSYAAQGSARDLVLLDYLALASGALVAVQVAAVGRLYMTEILLAGVLPFLATRTRQPRLPPLPVWVVATGAIWLYGQIVTDVVRESAFYDYSRGWAKILVTLVVIAALYHLLADTPRRIVLFLIGLGAGLLISFAWHPDRLAEAEPWKFGMGLPITLLVVGLLSLGVAQSSPLIGAAAMLALSGVHLHLGFRSLGGICFLTGVYLLAAEVRGSGFSYRWRAGRIIMLLGVCVAAGIGFVALYGHLANSGHLGSGAAAKYRLQAEGRFGVVVGGRPDLLVSLQAIQDSPVVGHGSWARDASYVSRGSTAVSRLGYDASSLTLFGDLIPSHSHLFGSWVEGGVAAVPFWTMALILAIRALAIAVRQASSLRPLTAFAAFALLWDVFLSPFSGTQRILIAFYITVLLIAQRSAKASPL